MEQGQSEVEAIRSVKQMIIEIHRLLAAYLADSYYLTIDPFYEPQLFSILLPEEIKSLEPYVTSLRKVQQRLQADYYQELEELAKEAQLVAEATKRIRAYYSE
jgi:(p)ppGpp synthase/HD superfamily hydrolase